MPPNPETMLAGLSSLKSGNTAPRPTDRPTKAKFINKTVIIETHIIKDETFNIILEPMISASVISNDPMKPVKNFSKSIRLRFTGARLKIQNLLPSRLS